MIDIDNYRDIDLAKNILKQEYIGFYTREFFCLDNFSAFIFEYKGQKFTTVEHAYQAYKFITTDMELFNKIKDCNSPGVAKAIAHQNIDKVRDDWEDIKVPLMESLIRCKMEQNPYVRKKLLETKDITICEDSPDDYFWGIGRDGKGANMLGKLWMKLRKEIQENK